MSRKPTDSYSVYHAGTRGIRVCRDDSVSRFIDPSRVITSGLSWDVAQETADKLRAQRGRDEREERKRKTDGRSAAAREGRAERVLALAPGARVVRLRTGAIGVIVATPTAGPIRPNAGAVLVRFVRRLEQLDAHLLRPAHGTMEG